MKNTSIITVIASLCFGWSQNVKPSERLISQLPQEVRALFNQHPISWKQSQNHPITESSRDEADLYGEWEHEDDNATLWVTSGTDQTIPNPAQVQGMDPADGARHDILDQPHVQSSADYLDEAKNRPNKNL